MTDNVVLITLSLYSSNVMIWLHVPLSDRLGIGWTWLYLQSWSKPLQYPKIVDMGELLVNKSCSEPWLNRVLKHACCHYHKESPLLFRVQRSAYVPIAYIPPPPIYTKFSQQYYHRITIDLPPPDEVISKGFGALKYLATSYKRTPHRWPLSPQNNYSCFSWNTVSRSCSSYIWALNSKCLARMTTA